MSPAWPLTLRIMASWSYLPEKHRSTRGPTGTPLQRLLLKAPSPVMPFWASTILPFRWAVTVMPPPSVTTSRFRSS